MSTAPAFGFVAIAEKRLSLPSSSPEGGYDPLYVPVPSHTLSHIRVARRRLRDSVAHSPPAEAALLSSIQLASITATGHVALTGNWWMGRLANCPLQVGNFKFKFLLVNTTSEPTNLAIFMWIGYIPHSMQRRQAGPHCQRRARESTLSGSGYPCQTASACQWPLAGVEVYWT